MRWLLSAARCGIMSSRPPPSLRSRPCSALRAEEVAMRRAECGVLSGLLNMAAAHYNMSLHHQRPRGSRCRGRQAGATHLLVAPRPAKGSELPAACRQRQASIGHLCLACCPCFRSSDEVRGAEGRCSTPMAYRIGSRCSSEHYAAAEWLRAHAWTHEAPPPGTKLVRSVTPVLQRPRVLHRWSRSLPVRPEQAACPSMAWYGPSWPLQS